MVDANRSRHGTGLRNPVQGQVVHEGKTKTPLVSPVTEGSNPSRLL